MVCGIRPVDIGFNQIHIAPSLGTLTSIKASMPHEKGRISVEYQKKSGKLSASVSLPPGTSGVWEYGGEQIELTEGVNKIK
jgi:hypothetical protein